MKLVGVHSVTSSPVSWFNEAAPDWWSKQLANVATGTLRDRPPPRWQRAETIWSALDWADRYSQFAAAGVNVIFLDLFSSSEHLVRQLAAMRGAEMAGVQVIPMPDGNSWSGFLVAKNGFDTEAKIIGEAVRRLIPLTASPACYALPDGRVLIAPYHAELWTPQRWLAVLQTLESNIKRPVAFLPDFQDFSKMAVFQQVLKGRMVGAGMWGNRTPKTVGSSLAQAKAAHALGLWWVQYTATQDNRPRESIFDEAANTGLLDATWQAAISEGAEVTMHTTADDYYEGTHLEPTDKRGAGWLSLYSYYAQWFKTGQPPRLLREALFLSHRLAPWNATPTKQTLPVMKPRGGVAQELIEVRALLPSPATVTLDGKQFTGKAGMNVFTAPLTPGTHRAQVRTANDLLVDIVGSPSSTQLGWQDVDYVMASNVEVPGSWFR
jgi:hypothetical protein